MVTGLYALPVQWLASSTGAVLMMNSFERGGFSFSDELISDELIVTGPELVPARDVGAADQDIGAIGAVDVANGVRGPA